MPAERCLDDAHPNAVGRESVVVRTGFQCAPKESVAGFNSHRFLKPADARTSRSKRSLNSPGAEVDRDIPTRARVAGAIRLADPAPIRPAIS